MTRILITGADGFLGRHLAEAASDFQPVLHVRRAESSQRWQGRGFAQVVHGELCNAKCLDEVPQVAAVIHLAGRSGGELRPLYESNVVATAALLEWMLRRGVPHLVLASTGAVYQDRCDRPAREDDPLDPPSHYAVSKVAAEMLVRRAVAESGGKLRAAILRFPHVYGPENRKGVVWNFLESAVTRGTVLLDGEGLQQRDFLYVDDAVRALIAAAHHETPGAQTLNIGTGCKTSLADLAVMLGHVLHRPVGVEKSGRAEQPPRCIWLNVEAAARALNWSAKVSLPVGLESTAAWRLALPEHE